MKVPALAAALGLAFSWPALTMELQPTVDLLMDANFACHEGLSHDGVPISEEAQKQACKDNELHGHSWAMNQSAHALIIAPE